jgi:hypothetical protein
VLRIAGVGHSTVSDDATGCAKDAMIDFVSTGGVPASCAGGSERLRRSVVHVQRRKEGEDKIVATFKDKAGETVESETVTKKWVKPTECTHAFGYGHSGPVGPRGLNEDNDVNTSLTGLETFEVTLPNDAAHYHLSKLLKASCKVIPGGHEFTGEVTAKRNSTPGYEPGLERDLRIGASS